MNLEQKVRIVVHDLADRAPNPNDLADVARHRGRRIRRRRQATTGVTVLVLATTAVVPFVVMREQKRDSPQPTATTPSPVRTTAAPTAWGNVSVRLPGDMIVTALSRNDVGVDAPAGRTLATGNVVFDRTTNRYVALRGDYYTVWGATEKNTGVVSDGANGLGIIRGDNSIKWIKVGYKLDPQWSPDGTRLLLSTLKGYAVVEAATGRVTRHETPEAIAACPDDCFFTWQPDGRTIAIAQRDLSVAQSEEKADTIKNVLVYNAGNGRPLATVDVPGVPVSGSPWSPNLRRVLVQTTDGAAIMDTATGKVVRNIPERNARFTPGGGVLGIGDEFARLYDADGKLYEEMLLPADFSGRTISAGLP
ncbi:hypothetical protein KOI35_08620 [Actinoplanes bogorensis]|uniref:WD40 repeat domain-containing protein n=1 Tax=Paractinoplanes bogorensis TaxID=1610840 RepID=A0ABS5YJC7_9ACTN|nr:hypothetical protein [Actinoplanes bogorensis]MBU2663567.1 hypothetical protein [Actinoplanes bogorensis]